ncbi:MAG: hypothetical protein JXA11_04590, partial [Phycisphaerae bacterium]|nr:hypothetical protein [Phycisphaerae bacterium]
MKKTLQSLVLVLTVAATGMVAQADVIYREIFPNETGGDIPLYESGWEASAASQEDPAYGISSNMGRTTDAEPVNSNYTGTERAKSYAWMST